MPVFDYKINFVNSQHENTNSKGNFMPKNWFKIFMIYKMIRHEFLILFEMKDSKNLYKKNMFLLYV